MKKEIEINKLVDNTQCSIKEAKNGFEYINKSGKMVDRILNLAVCATIIAPFLFVAKMYVVFTVCCISILVLLIITYIIQHQWDVINQKLKAKIQN